MERLIDTGHRRSRYIWDHWEQYESGNDHLCLHGVANRVVPKDRCTITWSQVLGSIFVGLSLITRDFLIKRSVSPPPLVKKNFFDCIRGEKTHVSAMGK